MSGKDNITLDPVAMNIVNRIAPGTKFTGTLECEGGVLVQGIFEGTLLVKNGPLVLTVEGVMTGDIECEADAYFLGKINRKDDGELSKVTVGGAAFMGSSLAGSADITAGTVKMYDGAQVENLRTIRKLKP
jgi:cytoskeletal protein CcmA (bactofilin family)